VATKRYTFPDNKLPYGWTATRYSFGGQNDGVWTRDIKNNKIYWHPTSSGTETGYFGEWLSVPVNAIGDINVEATVRGRATGGAPNGFIGVGINQSAVSRVKYGTQLNFPGAISVAMYGTNNIVFTPWPGRPGQSTVSGLGADYISNMRVVRKNGYLFLYSNSFYLGQYAYAPAITRVDIYSTWQTGQLLEDHWLQDLAITPSSVVL